MTSTIPVFYDPAQVSRPASYSPSAEKPRSVIARWHALGFPVDIVSPRPATIAQFDLAHDPRYVRGVLDLRIRNGFGTKDSDVAASLAWTTGSLLSAARAALAAGSVAVSPTSGFHHAGHAFGGGFCTFNGLMVTALALRESGLVRRVAILDCDEHYGDGTDDIIRVLDLQGFVRHVTAGRGYPRNPGAFLKLLPKIIAEFADCDLILYQAGADPHVDDPLGGWLSTEEIFERDLRVFKAARTQGIPIVWNLAGGYQQPIEKVLEIHDGTMLATVLEYLGPAAAPRDLRDRAAAATMQMTH